MLHMFLDFRLFILHLRIFVCIGKEVIDLTMASLICTNRQNNVPVCRVSRKGVVTNDLSRSLELLPVGETTLVDMLQHVGVGVHGLFL